jgi:hypothetical protein
VPVSKISQNRLRIVAECRQPEALPLELFSCILQLDQLLLAEGSPIRRTEENQDQTVATH